jgi:hypothetical protein
MAGGNFIAAGEAYSAYFYIMAVLDSHGPGFLLPCISFHDYQI